MEERSRIFLGLGECMVEMAPTQDGLFRQGFAGDVFNTLWYAARLLDPVWRVRFHTALGEDDLSRDLGAFAAAAGIDCGAAPRLPGATPGLYMIHLHECERRFTYWRGQSAARRMMEDAALAARQIEAADVVYLSGITLAILPPADRAALVGLCAGARAAGKVVAFDPNIRPALWEDVATMRAAITAAAGTASLVLPSLDDEVAAFGDAGPAETLNRYLAAGAEIVVVKNGAGPVLTATASGDESEEYSTPALEGRVVDTTAAGDAFNAAFLAAWLAGGDLAVAVRAGQGVAARTVQGHGALVPAATEPRKDAPDVR